MGNISDVLEKSGVELARKKDATVAEEPGVETDNEEAPLQHILSSSEAWDERLLKVTHSSTEAAESFRVLRSRILHPQDGRQRPQTIMVTSSSPQEGKSFVSSNLAVTMARGVDQYSLLVDCDLRRPSLAGLFGLSSICKRGLSDYLRDDGDLTELIHKTSVEKLSLLPSGSPPVNPAELLSSDRMAKLVTELSSRYNDRFIIFDSPPYQVASETNVLAKEVDGVVLVVGYGKSDKSLIKKMTDLIGVEKIIGVVFNGMKKSFIHKKVFSSYGNYGQYYDAEDSQK